MVAMVGKRLKYPGGHRAREDIRRGEADAQQRK